MTIGKDIEILSKKFRMFTESGAVEVDKDFKVKGDKIKLGYDPSKPDASKDKQDGETKPFSCKLSDYNFRPYANKKYHLVAEGKRWEGETDAEGVLKQDIAKSAKQVVVRLWIDDYPEGRQRIYNVKIDDVPAAESALGAKTRLKNLGYLQGPLNEMADHDLRSALLDFQADHQETHALDASGDLDAATAAALTDVHGS